MLPPSSSTFESSVKRDVCPDPSAAATRSTSHARRRASYKRASSYRPKGSRFELRERVVMILATTTRGQPVERTVGCRQRGEALEG